MNQTFGFTHFFTQADSVAWALLLILLTMSVCTWTFMVQRVLAVRSENTAYQAWRQHSLTNAQTARAHAKTSLFTWLYDETHPTEAAHAALPDDYLLDQCACQLDSGQTLLASIAATAPFVGLLGTVWGIYHALTAMAIAGEANIEKMMGPVGETLLMTALGLLVALPAVLSYNFIHRSNAKRVLRAQRFLQTLPQA